MQGGSIVLANGLVVLGRECLWAMLMIVAGGLLVASVILVFSRRLRRAALYLSVPSVFLCVLAFWPLHCIRVDYPSQFPSVCFSVSLVLLVVSLAVFVVSVVALVFSRRTSSQEPRS